MTGRTRRPSGTATGGSAAAGGGSPGKRARTDALVRRGAGPVWGAKPNASGPDAGSANEEPVGVDPAGAGGQPLPANLRGPLESAAGEGLEDVRLRADPEANDYADSLDARAVAVGSTIHFAEGELDASTTEGQHLIAHETAHAVQAGGDAASPALKPNTAASSGAASEIEADRFADSFVQGRKAEPIVERIGHGVAARSPAAAPATYGIAPWEQQQRDATAELRRAETRLQSVFTTLNAYRAAIDAIDPDAALVASRKLVSDYNAARSAALMQTTTQAAEVTTQSAEETATRARVTSLLSQVEMMMCMAATPSFRGQPIDGLVAKPAANDVQQYVGREYARTVMVLADAQEIRMHLARLDENAEPPQQLVDRVEMLQSDRPSYLVLTHILREIGGERLLAAKARDGQSLGAKAAQITRGVPQTAADIVATLEEAQGFAHSRDMVTAGALVRLALERVRVLGDQSAIDRVLRAGGNDGVDMGQNLEIASRANAEVESLATMIGRDQASDPRFFTIAINATRAAIPVYQLVSGERTAGESVTANAGEFAARTGKWLLITSAVVATAGMAAEAGAAGIMAELSLAADAATAAWSSVAIWAMRNPEAKVAVAELIVALGLQIGEYGVDDFVEQMKTPQGVLQVLMDILVLHQAVRADAGGHSAPGRAQGDAPSGAGSVRARLDDAVDKIRARTKAWLDTPYFEDVATTDTGHAVPVGGGSGYSARIAEETATNLKQLRQERIRTGNVSFRPTPGQRLEGYVPPEPGKQPFELRKQLMAEAKELYPVDKSATDEERRAQWAQQEGYFEVVEQHATMERERLEKKKAAASPDEIGGLEAQIQEARFWEEAAKTRPVAGKLPLNAEYAGSVYGPEDIRKNNPKNPELAEDAVAAIQAAGEKGIRFKPSGYPDLDPFVYESNGIKAQVEIQFSGNPKVDFDQADDMMRELVSDWRKPSGWTWHHHEDGKTMQLVPFEIHSLVDHTGGMATQKHKTGEGDD